MSRVRQRDTAAEMRVRHVATAMGKRYRTVNRDLPGSPDLANRSRQWAVFVHGCFWHQHERCSKATIPKTNRAFWLAKFSANKLRDKRAVAALLDMGFNVVTIWECQTNDDIFIREALKPLGIR